MSRPSVHNETPVVISQQLIRRPTEVPEAFLKGPIHRVLACVKAGAEVLAPRVAQDGGEHHHPPQHPTQVHRVCTPIELLLLPWLGLLAQAYPWVRLLRPQLPQEGV